MVSGDPVPLYLSFRFYTLPLPILPPPFSFYRTVSICDVSPKTMKTKCVERLMFFEIGARRLLEKYLILACTENQIKYYVRDYFHFGHYKSEENYILITVFCLRWAVRRIILMGIFAYRSKKRLCSSELGFLLYVCHF